MTAPVSPAVRRTTVAAVLLVAAVAAVVSYAHMREVAALAGEAWRSYLLPLSVDGLMVAASMVLLTRRRAGLAGGGLAWCALLAGVGASLAANVAAAEATVTARLVAAWPAVAFAVAFELLLEQRRPAAPGPTHDPEPAGLSTRVEHQVRAEPGDAAPPAVAVAEVAEVAPVRAADAEGEPAFDRCRTPALSVSAPPAAAGASVAGRGDDRVGELDVLAARTRELAAANGGRAPGRRALARQLEVTEHKARVVLDLVSTKAGAGAVSSNGAAVPVGVCGDE